MLSQISVTSMPRCLQLPGGQPRPLEQRPGLVGEDVEAPPLLGRGEHDGQGRAVIGRRQAAGVAVRQHALAFADQAAPAAPMARHMRAIFLLDRPRLVEQLRVSSAGDRSSADPATQRSMRSSAQKRLTAVGRLVRR